MSTQKIPGLPSADHLDLEKDLPQSASQMSTTSPDVANGTLNAEVSEPQEEYITGVKPVMVIAAISLVIFLTMLDISIIGTAIPKITSDFHSLPDVGWYGSAYLLASCALQPSIGKLYTYLNAKFTFLAFFAVFEFGSLLCGIASNSHMLIVGRAVAGMGSSGLMNGGLTIISLCLPLHKRPPYFGGMMGFALLGTIVAPIIGGSLTQYTTWRWCFYINLPAGAVIAMLLVLTPIPSRHAKIEGGTTVLGVLKRLDPIGFVFFAPATIQGLLALEWGGTRYAWSDAVVIGLFCGAAGTAVTFIAWECWMGDEAMIPPSMICQRIVWSSCLVIFFFFGALLNAVYYLPIYFQAVHNATPTMSGVYLLPMVLAQVIAAVGSGILVGKVGFYLPFMILSGALVAIGTGLLSTLTVTTSSAKWFGFEVLTGFGRGCGLQIPIVAVQNALPESQNSLAMSLVVFAQTFGGAVILAVSETDFTSSLTKGLANVISVAEAQAIVNAGASSFREVVDKDKLPQVLVAYNEAVRHTLYIGAACAVVVFVFAWRMGWKDIKKSKAADPKIADSKV